MRKRDLDHLLETAVARAIGVTLPNATNRPKLHKATRKSAARMPVRHVGAHAHL
jgi:hypothetical protein